MTVFAPSVAVLVPTIDTKSPGSSPVALGTVIVLVPVVAVIPLITCVVGSVKDELAAVVDPVPTFCDVVNWVPLVIAVMNELAGIPSTAPTGMPTTSPL